MIQSISKICEISTNQINIKGKTTEKLGLIGKEKAIACEVITSVHKICLIKLIFCLLPLFGIGKIKKIPGSFASLATTLFLFFLFHILKISPNIVLISIIIIFFNITLCSKYFYKRFR